MTSEERVYIAVKDLVEIEFRCKHCKAIFAWPLTGEGFRVNNCPGCNQEWFSEPSIDHRRKNLDQLLIALRGFRETLSNAQFELRLRVDIHAT
jgi:hypothetical protein